MVELFLGCHVYFFCFFFLLKLQFREIYFRVIFVHCILQQHTTDTAYSFVMSGITLMTGNLFRLVTKERKSGLSTIIAILRLTFKSLF